MSKPSPGAVKPCRPPRAPKNWKQTFLAALADSSNVTASAKRAGTSLSWVYKTRREDAAFARKWLSALCEGYDNLEMDLLCRLRSGESKDAAGNKHDNAMAIRLLTLHRADAARGRALRESDEEQAVLESIDAMIDAMRKRAAANAQLLLCDERREDGDEPG